MFLPHLSKARKFWGRTHILWALHVWILRPDGFKEHGHATYWITAEPWTTAATFS